MAKFGYKAKIDRYCNHHESSGEQFGSWSASYSNSFGSISIDKEVKYPDVVSDFEFKKNDDVYVVWVEWSSGDSFGWGERSGSEVMGVFKDKKTANELREAIQKHGAQEKVNKFECETSDGQKFESGFAPWSGYFERLEEVHIECTEIK